jgi:hypothetical protein
MGHIRRSAGSVRPWDIRKTFLLRGPSKSDSKADISAIENGEARAAICQFRASYGDYPKKFVAYYIDMNESTITLRPFALSRLWAHKIEIKEPILSAQVRAFRDRREAVEHLGTGQYKADGRLSWAGQEIVTCQTREGTLEFSVKRPDVPLFLRYIALRRGSRES